MPRHARRTSQPIGGCAHSSRSVGLRQLSARAAARTRSPRAIDCSIYCRRETRITSSTLAELLVVVEEEHAAIARRMLGVTPWISRRRDDGLGTVQCI